MNEGYAANVNSDHDELDRLKREVASDYLLNTSMIKAIGAHIDPNEDQEVCPPTLLAYELNDRWVFWWRNYVHEDFPKHIMFYAHEAQKEIPETGIPMKMAGLLRQVCGLKQQDTNELTLSDSFKGITQRPQNATLIRPLLVAAMLRTAMGLASTRAVKTWKSCTKSGKP